jgi:hypothetical protein
MGMMAILQHPAVREAAPVCPKINQKNVNSYCNGKISKRRTIPKIRNNYSQTRNFAA